MKANLDILTKRQEEAYLLHQRGLSYEGIAAATGITPAAARHRVASAKKKLQEAQNSPLRAMPVDLELSDGEFEVILAALRQAYYRMIAHSGAQPFAEQQRDPYDAYYIKRLYNRLQIISYGSIRRPLT